MASYQIVKQFENMFKRFHTIATCDRGTDKQTSYDGIVRAYAEHRGVKTRKPCSSAMPTLLLQNVCQFPFEFVYFYNNNALQF